MNCCAQCGGKFGLVRHVAWRRQFCTVRCRNDHEKRRQQHAVTTSFFRWLHRRRPAQKSSA